MDNPMIALIRSRRIKRFFSSKTIPRESLEAIVEARSLGAEFREFGVYRNSSLSKMP